jgi:molybdenum cofactor cytidylyltransferase
LLAAVILSAGASSRMGRAKALLPFREGTFLEHLIEVTRHPRIGVTRVVLGAGGQEIQTIAKLNPSIVVFNKDWERGQLSSIQAGLRSLRKIITDGIMLCLVDHPLISARQINDLVERFYAETKAIILPTYNGRRGHPVIFAKSLYKELMSAPADKGARAVVWAHAADILEVPSEEEGVVLNINDPDMLKRAVEPDPE